MIQVGRFDQKAGGYLVVFVFGCILMITGVLHITQQITADALGVPGLYSSM